MLLAERTSELAYRGEGLLFDVVCGVNVTAFWKIRLYIEGEYVYSSKTADNIEVIDFSFL